MKRNILLAVLSLFLTVSYAQIDRSKQPKPGPAPEINLKDPQTFALKNGMKVMVVENHKLPRVSIQLTIDNPLIVEGDKAGVASLTSSLLGNGSKTISKDDFNEEVDYLGANINFGSQSAFASSLSKYFPRILELMADAAINPNFTEEEFDKEKDKLIEGIKSNEKSVTTAARRVEDLLAFGADHPYGEYTSIETVNNVSVNDVSTFYNNYFKPNNAYLVVIGDVKFKDVKKLVKKHFKNWQKGTVPTAGFSNPQNVSGTQIDFVEMPNAVQSEIAVQNTVDLAMKDADYFPALIANNILGGGGEARLFNNLREDKGYTYGSYSRIGNDSKTVSRFRASASVRNAVTDSSVVELLKEIHKIANEPVSDEELKNVKAKYVGNFVMALERPQTIARYALNIETEGLPKDYYKTYLAKIDAVSKADVQKAAKKYFMGDNARVVVTGKGSEVLDNLEKVEFNGKKLPVKYYDKFGESTKRPEFVIPIPADVNVQKVLNNYIDAIGGRAKLDNVNSFLMKAEASMQGMKLELEMKKTTKKQFMQDVKVMGNSMQKQVLDGDKGYAMIQGQKKDMSDDELKEVQQESSPFPEIDWLSGGATLEKIEKVDGKKAYVIKVSDDKNIFYDVETGLKLQEVTTREAGGRTITSTLTYADYKEVSGIKFPFKLSQSAGPQKFDFTVTEVKVNEGVSDADFN